ncbi:MAG: PAS domain-containing protein [Anaerolineae bacterium]|nr:PAS domain-containing protein [Anaerolineae bacterium]
MVNWVRNLFSIPHFEDADQMRVARVLNLSLLVMLAGGILFAVATPLAMPERLYRIPITFALLALIVAMLYILRTGRVRFVAFTFTSLLWLLFSYATLTSGGIQHPGFTLQILVVVIAALTLGGKIALAFAGLSGLFGFGMYLAEQAGTLPSGSGYSLPASATTQLLAMFTIAVLLHQAARSINEALARSRQTEYMLAERNRLLETEVHERKRIEAELRESQTRLTEAQEMASIGAWESDLQTGEEIWSDETRRHLGFEDSDLRPTFELFLSHVHPDDRPIVARKLSDSYGKESTLSTQYRVVLADGHVRYIASRAQVQSDAEGRPVKLVGITQDITQQKTAQAALTESEAQLRLATDAAQIGIWDWDVQTNAVKWSDRTYQIFGLPPEAPIETSMNFRARVHPDDQHIIATTLADADADGQTEIGDFRIVRDDGSIRWVYERGKVYYDAAGAPVRVIGTIQDITERKQAEQAQREQGEILQTIFDHIPLMVAVFDAERHFKLVNRAWEYILGWSLAEVQADTDVLISLYGDEQQLKAVDTFVKAATTKWGDFRVRTRDGREVDTAWANIQLSNGLIIAIGQDISERQQAEQQRLELAVEKERVSLLKEFIGNMSHDLKTPLSVIKTSLYLLERVTDPERQQSKMETIKQQVLLLEKLIEDVLTMSQLDHTPELTLASVDLNHLLTDVEHKLRPSAEGKRLSTRLELDSHLPPVLASESELFRVMANLLENAIKYTPEPGTVVIRTRMDHTMVVTEVIDTGIGISPQEMPRIFERFFRANQARSIDIPGTGLGLAIVKRIVDMHHGQIEVESTPGKGSVFRVLLPVYQMSLVDSH